MHHEIGFGQNTSNTQVAGELIRDVCSSPILTEAGTYLVDGKHMLHVIPSTWIQTRLNLEDIVSKSLLR